MMILFKAVSFLGLALTVVPAFLVFAGVLSWETHAGLMFAGTILWFIAAPAWMLDEKPKLWFWKKRRPV